MSPRNAATPVPAPGSTEVPAPRRRRIVPGITSAALIGGLALTSGLALTASSGWLIVAASFQPQILTLLAVIVLVRAFGIARPVLRYVERVKSHDAALGFLAEKRTQVYRDLIALTPARLGRRGRGDVLTGVVDDLDDIAYAHVRVVVPLIALAVTGLVAALLNALFLYPAALVVLGTVAVAALVGWVDFAIERATGAQVVAARAKVGQIAATITTHADDLRAIGGQTTMVQRLTDAERTLTRAVTRQAWGRAVGSAAAPVVAIIGGVVMAVTVDPYVQRGLSTPIAALLVLTPVALGEVIGAVPDAMGALARAQAAKARLDTLLQQQPAVAAAAHLRADDTHIAQADTPAGPSTDTGDRTQSAATPLGSPEGDHEQVTLGLEAVQATWDERRPALTQTTLNIPAGTFLTATGSNGSGKSTLLAVLARHLDPCAGSYRHNTEDALALPLPTARARMAVVDDETHVLASNLRENLRFTRPGASDQDLVAALGRAGLGAWFDSLPQGLDTRLGADGQGVSGGERARIGIARALLSARPVILLDEPVAHLDHPTALAVLADLRTARQDQTIVLVSHRDEGRTEADAHLHLGSPAELADPDAAL